MPLHTVLRPARLLTLLTAVAIQAAVATPVAEAPTYRTQLPPSATLNYAMQRGSMSGTGELVWRRTPEGYEASLQGRVAGLTILTWVSTGALDKTGLAPLRFTDQRLRKELRVATFQRQAGKITYTPAAGSEVALVPGAQDRLSWMIQIAAIASADPKLVAPGGRVSMFVTGARGDGQAWAFQVQGNEDVRVGDVVLRTVKLLREPRKPNDTKVEVWLDPARHYLPVRARLSADDSAFELQLASLPS